VSAPAEWVTAAAEINTSTCGLLEYVAKVAAIAAASVVLVTFVFTTLIHESASIVTLVVILVVSIALDYWWKRSRTSRAGHIQVAH